MGPKEHYELWPYQRGSRLTDTGSELAAARGEAERGQTGGGGGGRYKVLVSDRFEDAFYSRGNIAKIV